MNKINLEKIKETLYIDTYSIKDDFIKIDSKTIDLTKPNGPSLLSYFLKKKNINLLEYLGSSVTEFDKCIHCGNKTNRSNYRRKKLLVYRFCDCCNKETIKRDYRKINCVICNKEILNKDKVYSTCGGENCLSEKKKSVYDNIKKTHWTKTPDFNKIIKKRTKKRKENDVKYNRKYVPWNKGKTNIYSKETIDKIRNATINQMKNGKIKKTGQEKIFEEFLIENEIKYTYSFIYQQRQYDFLIEDFDLVVELQGDYWHANPKFWNVNEDLNSDKKSLYETQKMKIKDDVIKKDLIEKSKYKLLVYWEHDILNNFSKIKEEILKIIKNN